jgi:ubiquinone/menaquinone biosynthesis C-methylase UbiE
MRQDPLEMTRALLNQPAALRHGFLDVLGESTEPGDSTLAQRAMNSPLLATVYERLWRPASFYLASGVTTQAEQRRAAAALHLPGAQRLLDAACGPGNFTGPLAAELPADALAVGLDLSEPMLTRAVQDNGGPKYPRTCYVRGDAHHMPFDDETFDAVCCFGALYLVPEPFVVTQEMVRVLRPGGRIAILTSYSGQAAPIRRALTAVADAIGLTMFDGHTFVEEFESAGLVDLEQHTQRALQFVAAGKPG